MLRLSILISIAAAIAFAALASQFPPPEPAQVEAGIFEAANGFRAENRLGVLTRNAALNAEARRFAEYLARTNTFSHTADGREPSDRAQEAGYDYCDLAENLASEADSSGVGLERLVRLMMAGWEASPGHRRNLLDPMATETGVGVARAPGSDQKYVAVQVFGLPASARFSFSVDNQSDEMVGYVFDGQRHSLQPRSTLVTSTCAVGELVFDHGVGARDRRYPVRPGAAYVLSSAPEGVQIEVRRAARPRGRLDQD